MVSRAASRRAHANDSTLTMANTAGEITVKELLIRAIDERDELDSSIRVLQGMLSREPQRAGA